MIVDAHEHLESADEYPPFKELMTTVGIDQILFVGSGDATIYEKGGFDNYIPRNLDILKLAREDGVYVFPTLNPLDKNNEALLDHYLKLGASGIKLYYGLGSENDKGPWHSAPLDYPGMDPIFARCTELRLPVLFHVNRVRFFDEMLSLLKKFPDLKVCFPHLMVSTKNRQRMEMNAQVMDNFYNVYTDNSHGREDHFLPVAETVTRLPKFFRAWFAQYSGRIMFGTDLVITKEKMVNRRDYVVQMMQWYRMFCEQDVYEAPPVSLHKGPLRGLALQGAELRNLYEGTFRRFIESKVKTMGGVGRPQITQGLQEPPQATIGPPDMSPVGVQDESQPEP